MAPSQLNASRFSRYPVMRSTLPSPRSNESHRLGPGAAAQTLRSRWTPDHIDLMISRITGYPVWNPRHLEVTSVGMGGAVLVRPGGTSSNSERGFQDGLAAHAGDQPPEMNNRGSGHLHSAQAQVFIAPPPMGAHGAGGPVRPKKRSLSEVEITEEVHHDRVHQNKKRKREVAKTVTPTNVPVHLHDVKRVFKDNEIEVKQAVTMANSSGVYRLYKNLCIIRDHATCEVIAIIKFTPFDSMDDVEMERLERMSRYLVEEKGFSYRVKLNSFMRSGYMGALGWRKGYILTQFFGIYAPPSVVRTKKKHFLRWRRRLFYRQVLERWYRDQFGSLSQSLLKEAQDQVKELKLPSFGQLDCEEAGKGIGFAGNLTFTFNRFSNVPHRDHDVSNTTFFYSVPIFKDGKLAHKADGFDVVDGRVFFADLGVTIELGACDGTVAMIYYGNKDRHCTLPSKEPSKRFTRLSTSVQISDSYADRVMNPGEPLNKKGQVKVIGGASFWEKEIRAILKE